MTPERTMQAVAAIWDRALGACNHSGGEDDPCADCLQMAEGQALAAARVEGLSQAFCIQHRASVMPLTGECWACLVLKAKAEGAREALEEVLRIARYHHPKGSPLILALERLYTSTVKEPPR